MNRGRHKKSKKKNSILKQKSQILYRKNFVYYYQYLMINYHIIRMIIMQERGLVVMMEETIIKQLHFILIAYIILMILYVKLKEHLMKQLLKIVSIQLNLHLEKI